MAMFTKGHIIVKRTIKEWGWYHNPNMLAFWVHLLVEANYKDGYWEGVVVRRGELVTSLSELAKDVGISLQEVRTILKRLGASGEVRSRRVGRRSILTIYNYDSYQIEQQDDNTIATCNQHDNNTTTTSSQHVIIEQGNNVIREKEKKTSNEVKESYSSRFVKPTLKEVEDYCRSRNNGIDPEAFIAFYESKGWKVGKTPMKSWQAAVITWEKKRNGNDNGNLFTAPQPADPDWLVEGKRYRKEEFEGHDNELYSLDIELIRHVKRGGALTWKDGKFIIAK